MSDKNVEAAISTMTVQEPLTAIPTDFYTDAGFVMSITICSHPSVGDTVVKDGKMYTVKKIAWDFDCGGIPLLVRINVE